MVLNLTVGDRKNRLDVQGVMWSTNSVLNGVDGMLTTNRTSPGEFEVLWHGQPTPLTIINGSHGYTGPGAPNMYGVVKGNAKPVWIGTLANAKGIARQWLASGLVRPN